MIQSTLQHPYTEALAELYIRTFMSETSAQWMDKATLHLYLDGLIRSGFSYVSVDGEKLTGAILVEPMKHQSYIPEAILQNSEIDKSVYIAELMVAETYRGQGIGQQLIEKVVRQADKEGGRPVFIRVWDKNTTALKLYQRMGFEPVCEIDQERKTLDGQIIKMRKIYLKL